MPENPRPRPVGPLRAGSLLVASATLAAALALTGTGCGGTQTPGPMLPTADSNVPAPPNVDRSKCDDKGKQVITADTNQDKKPDVWKFFVVSGDVQVLSCKQV